jgi:diguanylate cyclase (GGDEF)-like protein/PAS domain S-box-containing protein
MHQYILFIILAPIAVLSASLVNIKAWRQRKKPAAFSFGVFMSIVTGWILSYVLELLASSDEITLFWSRFGYVFISTIALSLFIFVARFLGQDKWFRPGMMVFLILLPIATNILIWHEDLHSLMWEEYSVVPYGDLSINIIQEYGIWFWVSNGISYLLIFFSLFMLIRYALRSSMLYRQQATWILLGSFFPIAVNLLYVFRVIPKLTMDFTPIAFAVSGVFVAMGIFRDKLFDLSPFAREMLLDHIDDGLILIDDQDRVVDSNPAASFIFAVERKEFIGKSIKDLLLDWEKILTREGDPDGHHTIALVRDSQKCHYDVKVSHLVGRRNAVLGRIILLRDVTERVRLLEDVQQLAIRDALTEAYNRRHFFHLANQILEQSIRYQRPVAILVLDIDHFKRINDAFGHITGDRVLKRFTTLCKQVTRASDILARYGGEEFVIFLPETTRRNAYSVAERLRQKVASTPVLDGEESIYMTVSIGVASYDPLSPAVSLDVLLGRADQSLYQAKQNGRNRVVLWEDESQPVR